MIIVSGNIGIVKGADTPGRAPVARPGVRAGTPSTGPRPPDAPPINGVDGRVGGVQPGTMNDLTGAARVWQRDGFVILPAFLDAEDIAAAQAGLGKLYPSPEAFHDDPDSAAHARYRDEFGGITNFPFDDVELSLLAVHPGLVRLAEAILGSEDLRIYTIEAWAKFTAAADYRQAHHRDYLNHTPLVPSSAPQFRQLEMFVYLSDVTIEHGPTHLVSRTVTGPVPALPHAYLPSERPEWYAAEVPAAGPAGTVLAYSVDTFHRGTAMRAPRGARYTMQVNFRAAANEWMTRHSWGDRSFEPAWTPFVHRATPRQLQLFGFPPPGHPFWTPETLTGMAERYPSLDLSAWRLPERDDRTG